MRVSRWTYYLRSIPRLLWDVRPRRGVLWAFLGGATPEPLIIVLRGGLQFLVRNAMDIWIVKESCLDRVYEHKQASISQATVSVDIGAGIGDFTLYAARESEHGTVYAYEPDAESFALLERNIALNGANNVRAHRQAVSGRVEARKVERDEAHPVRSRTSPVSSDTVVDEQVVASIALDDLFALHRIERCDVLKIDCEGGEYDILFHASEATLRRVRYLVLEYHDSITPWQHPSLVAFLSQRGFVVERVPSPAHADIGYLYAWENK